MVTGNGNRRHTRAQSSVRPAGKESHTAHARTFTMSDAWMGLSSAGKQAGSDAFEKQQLAVAEPGHVYFQYRTSKVS